MLAYLLQAEPNVRRTIVHSITDQKILNVVNTTIRYDCTEERFAFDYPKLKEVSLGQKAHASHVTITCNGNG